MPPFPQMSEGAPKRHSLEFLSLYQISSPLTNSQGSVKDWACLYLPLITNVQTHPTVEVGEARHSQSAGAHCLTYMRLFVWRVNFGVALVRCKQLM